MSNRKIEVLASLLDEHVPGDAIEQGLVVGCGDGSEAVYLADHFAARFLGIDIEDRFATDTSDRVELAVMDAMALDLPDASIDLVYSFHALEHIADPVKALAEMRRVLRPGGWYCIGTPNRSRLVGYVGSRTSLANKIRWNAQDYRDRLRGRFRNELGAHAGFTAPELAEMCRAAFGEAEDVTEPYYRGLYDGGRTGTVIRAAAATGTASLVHPCVYILGRATN